MVIQVCTHPFGEVAFRLLPLDGRTQHQQRLSSRPDTHRDARSRLVAVVLSITNDCMRLLHSCREGTKRFFFLRKEDFTDVLSLVMYVGYLFLWTRGRRNDILLLFLLLPASSSAVVGGVVYRVCRRYGRRQSKK